MYDPKEWAEHANKDLYQLWNFFMVPDSFDNRRRKRGLFDVVGLEISPVTIREFNDKPSNTMEAITCGDSPDLTDVTTNEVFDEILRVTRDVSGFCAPFSCNLFSLDRLHWMHL